MLHHTPYPINLASKKAAPAYPTSRDDIAHHLIGAKMSFNMSLCSHDFLPLIECLLVTIGNAENYLTHRPFSRAG
jgi:hypothetical protein